MFRMKKLFLIPLSLWLFLLMPGLPSTSVFLQAQSQVHSKGKELTIVTVPYKVAVYPDRALVTRRGLLRLPAGLHTVQAIHLPYNLNKDSLRVSVESVGRVKIYSTDLLTDYNSTANNRPDELQKQLLELEKQKFVYTDKLKRIHSESRMLESIRVKNIEDKNKEIAIGKFDPDNWEKLLNFYAANLDRLAGEKRAVTEKLALLNKKIYQLKQQIGQSKLKTPVDHFVNIALYSPKETSITVKISYLISPASWVPKYEIYTSNGLDVQLRYMANIRQNTGENWNNVILTLSTAKPALGIQLPPVNPLTLSKQQPVYYHRQKRRSAYGSAPKSKPDAQKREELDFVEEKQKDSEAEYETPDVGKNFTSVTFQMKTGNSIASDNSYHEVMIASEKLNAFLNYKAAPYLTETAYAEAKIRNNLNYPLLAGSTNLFIDNTFAGTSSLKEIAPHENFFLPLGPDSGIKIKYQKIKEYHETYGIGSKRKKTTYQYKITVENLKNMTVYLDLNDRIPVSTDADIKVNLLKTDPKNDNDLQADRGVLKWKLTLKPKAKKVIEFSYTIDAPENMSYIMR